MGLSDCWVSKDSINESKCKQKGVFSYCNYCYLFDKDNKLISEFLEDLKWAEYKILEINRQVALNKLIKKWEEKLK